VSRAVWIDGKQFADETGRFHFQGVTYGTFRPRTDGARYPERDGIKRDFAAMSEAGFNVVRTYTLPPDDMVDLAADWGLHLLAGVFWPDWRYLVGGSRRQCREVARAAENHVRDAARHIAGREEVLALCLGNEVPADVIRWVGTTRVAQLIARLADVVREEDPDRLVTYANYPSAEYLPLDGLDFLTFNIFLDRSADLRRYLTRLHHLAGDRPLVLGEIGVDAGRAPDGSPDGERAQAEALDRHLETALERGVAGSCLFSWTDEWWVGDSAVEGWHFGLTRADRSPRPALAVAERWNRRTVSDLLPAHKWPSISVVVCAYNARETLDECLRHTCALDYPGLEIIVVDDGSTDETAAIARRYPRCRLVTIDHAGLSVARNEGFRAATGELIAYLDADAFPSAEWLRYLALGLDSRFVAGVGGPNLGPPSDPIGAQRVSRAPGGPVHVLVADDRAEHIPGCNMAFWRDVLDEVGGFEPVYTAAGDDVDVCWKVLDRGWEIGFHPAALVWHHRRPAARAYLRQQRGYGRAESLVAARHPDRFNSLGTARWRGRIYNSLVPSVGRQRVYRGTFGAAAYQSVYGAGGTALDVAHQLGVPLAGGLLLTAPLALMSPLFGLPSVVAVLVLVTLGIIDASRAVPPNGLRDGRRRFRAGVALLSLAQPLVRTWGRLTTTSAARRDLPPPSHLTGPARPSPRGVLLLPSDGPRERATAGVVEVVRRAGLDVVPPTGWENHDVRLHGSLLVAGDLVTSGHVEGTIQVRVRRQPRLGFSAVIATLIILAALVNPALGAGVAAVAIADALFGAWRTGPIVRRAILHAAGEAA
jgi:glycosyltransferase involved in cell wall biosynthesis